jgi:anti-anti-sigma regulatory factor
MLTDPHIEVGLNPDRTTTVRIAGEVSSATHATLREALDGAVGTGPLIVDLTAVTHLDTAGVDLLRELAGERGLEVVVGPGCPVFSVVQVSGLCEAATVQCR